MIDPTSRNLVPAAAFVLASLALGSCLSPVCPAGDSACLARPPPVAGTVHCEQYLGTKEKVCVTIQPVVCAGITCEAGSECCFTTGLCFNPTEAGKCPAPDAGLACGSNSQCAAGEACVTIHNGGTQFCSGLGRCQPRDNCGSCGPEGEPLCQACGCDGHTYQSIQAACVAGVRVAARGPCGTGVRDGPIGCGSSAQCPAGQDCCWITGECFDKSQPWRCEVRPDGGVLNCANSSECNQGSGGSGGSDRYCDGDSCGTPGRCRSRASSSDCGGLLSPVCGCDQQTYTNECWARNAGVLVASAGACDGG